MKRISIAFLILLPLLDLPLQAAATRAFTFDRSRPLSEWKIPLAQFSPELPADWPDADFVIIELRASSSQRLDFRVYTSDGYARLRLHPYPSVWIRAAIPVAALSEPPSTGSDMAAVANRSRVGYFLGLTGP